jgi:hypothetical protein
VTTRAFFDKLFRQDPAEKTRKVYQERVDAINVLEPAMQALSDDQLRGKTQEFKQRAAGGESLESLLPEAFAVGVHRGACALAGRPVRCQDTCGGTLGADAPASTHAMNARAQLHRARVRAWHVQRLAGSMHCTCTPQQSRSGQRVHRLAAQHHTIIPLQPLPPQTHSTTAGARGVASRAGPAPL